MKNDDISDAELDAFLSGKDALSRALHALPQPASHAALDAAILGRVRRGLEQEQKQGQALKPGQEQAQEQEQGPLAANDAGATPVLRRRTSFATRWRMPVGIAATVLAGVFAHQAFQASRTLDEAALMVAVQEQVTSPPARTPVVEEPKAKEKIVQWQAPVAAPERKSRPAPAPVSTAPPSPPQSAVAGQSAAKPAPDLAPQQFGEIASAPAPAPSPTPAAAAAAANLAERVTVTGASIRRGIAIKAAGEWLGEIEALLKAKRDEEARAQWQSFRKTYPDYPVSEELTAKLQ